MLKWLIRIQLMFSMAVCVAAAATELPDDFISSVAPTDIVADGQSIDDVTLKEAAEFSWKEFIALSWPAKEGARGKPASVALDASDVDATVWETYRGRVEVYPGTGDPPGFDPSAADFGFSAGPKYIYNPRKVGADSGGEVVACTTAGKPPWNNLDEINQQDVRSGLSPADRYPGQQILVESKVNEQGYVYVASRGWYGKNSIRKAARRTGRFIRTNMATPKLASAANDPEDTEYISFPLDTREVKAAWRRLGPLDDKATFYRNRVRYYSEKDGQPCYFDSGDRFTGDDQWGLVGFHIARKTKAAPYFIWATFEHVANLVDAELGDDGKPQWVEDAGGRELSRAGERDMYAPDVKLVAATLEADQFYEAESLAKVEDPQNRLYYRQPAIYDIPANPHVAVNKRMFATPSEIVEINKAVQAKLLATAPDSPLRFYRLVAVQWKPLDKPPGVVYEGPESPAIYYAAGVVVEAPPVHQQFSGQFIHGFSLASDYLHRDLLFLNPQPNPGEPVFFNTYFEGKGSLAGGCMGCHGIRQSNGTDWSFLLFRQRVKTPDYRLEAEGTADSIARN